MQFSPFGFFLHDPVIELLADGRKVRVVFTLRFIRPSGAVVEVPAGFVCDGASIPRIIWPLAGGPFEGKHRDAALVHDFLYSEIRRGGWHLPRPAADRVFYEAMRASGVSFLTARAKWLAVRLFGGKAAA